MGTRAADSPLRCPPRCERPSSKSPRPRNRRQGSAQLHGERRERLCQHRGTAHDHDGCALGRGVATRAVRLAQPAASPIALDGILELSTHGEPCTCRPRRLAPQHNEGGPVDTSASLEKRLKISAGGQPLASGKATRYTVSRLRPLARRRLSTFRPPFVFMRSRKPCVFARRRRLG